MTEYMHQRYWDKNAADGEADGEAESMDENDQQQPARQRNSQIWTATGMKALKYTASPCIAELKHERYDEMSHMTQWSKNALPYFAEHRKDWVQNERSLSTEAKWHKTQFALQVLSNAGERKGSPRHLTLLQLVHARPNT